MNYRIRFLKKLSQISTNELAKEVVSIPLPNFKASEAYPNIINVFGTTIVPKINNLTDILHRILHYSTNGRFSMDKLKSTGFTVPSNAMPNIINLVNFAKIVFDNFLNQVKKLSKEDIKNKLNTLYTSSSFSNLEDTPVSGQLANNTGGSTSNKAKITQLLNAIRDVI
jgi:hypothetical protein